MVVLGGWLFLMSEVPLYHRNIRILRVLLFLYLLLGLIIRGADLAGQECRWLARRSSSNGTWGGGEGDRGRERGKEWEGERGKEWEGERGKEWEGERGNERGGGSMLTFRRG